jgi:hypothetical protein
VVTPASLGTTFQKRKFQITGFQDKKRKTRTRLSPIPFAVPLFVAITSLPVMVSVPVLITVKITISFSVPVSVSVPAAAHGYNDSLFFVIVFVLHIYIHLRS